MDVDNKNFEGIKVKEEIEDASYHEIKQEIIEDDLSNTFIKQECKLEVNWDCAEDEHVAYDENLQKWTSTNANSTKNCYGKQLFQCPKCPVKTKFETNLNKHISFMHPTNKLLGHRQVQNKTRNVQKIFLSQRAGNRNDLLLGKENSLNIQNCVFSTKKKFLFSCLDCSFRCNLKFEFIYHVYKCHYNNNNNNNNNSQSEIFVCPYCGKRYTHNQEKHLVYCKINMCNYLQCDHCSNHFKGKYSLTAHIFKMHFKGGIFIKIKENNLNQTMLQPCPRCGKRYQHSLQLSQHVATCGKKHFFHCNTCLYTTNSQYSLAAHILQHLKKSNLCLDLSYGFTKNVL